MELDERGYASNVPNLSLSLPPLPQHKCSEGHLRVLLFSDDEDIGAGEDLLKSLEKRDEGETTTDNECQILEFMGFSANPNQSPQTIKLHVELKGIPIQVLVNSGASHNFISHKLVSKLGLSINYFDGMISDWETAT